MLFHRRIRPGKRGCLPDSPDVRKLHLADYAPRFPQPPPPQDWTRRVKSWPLLGNGPGGVGDCVPVAMLYQEQIWAGGSLSLTDSQALSLYSAVSPFRPDQSGSDKGTDPATAYKFWAQTGVMGDKIDAYLSISPDCPGLCQAAIVWFGGIQVAVNLPDYAERCAVWSATNYPAPTEGGHMVCFGGVKVGCKGKRWFIGRSWGEEVLMSDGFLSQYGYLVRCALSRRWLGPTGIAPNGLDYGKLQADLAKVKVG